MQPGLLVVVTAAVLLWALPLCVLGAAPEIIAHRGASADAPENTLAAFKLAWEQKADGIEGDFRLTRDGQIVCSHDATTKRVGDRTLEVAASTLEELRQVDVGSWKGPAWKGERMPTIGEALAAVPPGRKIFVEIYTPKTVPVLKRAIAESGLRPEQVVVISFERKAVAAAKEELAGIKAHWLVTVRKDKTTGAPTPEAGEILATLREIRADGLDCCANDALDRALVDAVRGAGFEFHAWTVDDAREARRLASYGVQSITTNRPQWIRDRLAGGAGE
jgi:glycerophosphoryl diester phosphodiesterase